MTELIARTALTAPVHRLGFAEALDRWFWPKNGPPAYPPLFIIGAPRSGSTLLYQVLLNFFRFGYLSNIHNHFHRFPCLIDYALAPLSRRLQFEEISDFGVTPGIFGPSESGAFWYRWFNRRPQYIGPGVTSPEKIEGLRRTVAALTHSAGAPFLFKNMPCAMRLGALKEAFPKALFIVTERKIEDVAISILKTREEVHGDRRKWWSIEPPGFEALLEKEPEVQVVWQIKEIDRIIRRDGEIFGASSFHRVSYEKLCGEAPSVLAEIEDFLRSHGVALERKATIQSGKTFAIRSRSSAEKSPRLLARVQRALEAAK